MARGTECYFIAVLKGEENEKGSFHVITGLRRNARFCPDCGDKRPYRNCGIKAFRIFGFYSCRCRSGSRAGHDYFHGI